MPNPNAVSYTHCRMICWTLAMPSSRGGRSEAQQNAPRQGFSPSRQRRVGSPLRVVLSSDFYICIDNICMLKPYIIYLHI